MKLFSGREKRKRISNKKAVLLMLYAIYIAFLLIFTIPYFSGEDVIQQGSYGSHLTFPKDGSYGVYNNVVLQDKSMEGEIYFEYHFDSNSLYVQKIENIEELSIDCELMFKHKYIQLFGHPPNEDDYYKDIFADKNDGLFTVILNTDTPMKKIQFLNAPVPKSVLVNDMEWWNNRISGVVVEGDDITVTCIPTGTTTVNVYFDDDVLPEGPLARCLANKYTVIVGEEITFEASESAGEISHYIWDFGDTNKGSGESMEHAFSESGTYTVTLTVRDNNYRQDTSTMTVTVLNS